LELPKFSRFPGPAPTRVLLGRLTGRKNTVDATME
jgi:hypothetical protein